MFKVSIEAHGACWKRRRQGLKLNRGVSWLPCAIPNKDFCRSLGPALIPGIENICISFIPRCRLARSRIHHYASHIADVKDDISSLRETEYEKEDGQEDSITTAVEVVDSLTDLPKEIITQIIEEVASSSSSMFETDTSYSSTILTFSHFRSCDWYRIY